MKSLSVNFWSRCGNNCIFCFCREKDFVQEKINPVVVSSPLKVGRSLLANRKECNHLILSGNEPTLNPNLLLTILLAKKIGYSVEIRTNGRRLKDKKFCLKLLRAGVDTICITALSFNQRTHDFLTGAKGSLKDTVLGIKNLALLDAGQRIVLYNVITKYNFKQLEKTTEFFSKLGVKNFQFNCVYHTDKKIVPKFSEIEKYLHSTLKFIGEKKYRVGVYGMPLCFLGKYQKKAVEFNVNNEVILKGRIADYYHLRKNLGKKKAKYCRGCKWYNVCEGSWKSYYKVYGEEEFKNKKIYEKS